MKKVLVAGSTGYLGRYIIKTLKEHGYRIRALVRNPNVLERSGKQGAPPIRSYIDEVFQGEVTKPHTLQGMCDQVDFVISTIGITRQKDGVTFHDVDYQGNVHLLLEAEASRVEKFMYISVFKGNEMSGVLNHCKEQFVDRLNQSELAHTIVRPTGYFSDMGEFLGMAIKGRVFLIGKGERQMNPIHGADLAEICVKKLTEDCVEVNVGGPQIFSHRELARLAFQVAGRREKITHIPPWLFKAAITPLKKLSPNDYGATEFLYNVMTHDLVAPEYGTRDLQSYFEQRMASET